MGNPNQPQGARGRASDEDGVELSDEELEYVVGGVDPEFFSTQARYLQELYGVQPRTER